MCLREGSGGFEGLEDIIHMVKQLQVTLHDLAQV